MAKKFVEILEPRVLFAGTALGFVGESATNIIASDIQTTPGTSLPLAALWAGDDDEPFETVGFVSIDGRLMLQDVDIDDEPVGDPIAATPPGLPVNLFQSPCFAWAGGDKTWIAFTVTQNNVNHVYLLQMDGDSVSIPAFQVDDFPEGSGSPTLSANPRDGSVMVTYLRAAGASGNNSIAARAFDINGSPTMAEFQLSATDMRDNTRQVLGGPVSVFDPVANAFDVAWYGQSFDLNNHFAITDQDIFGRQISVAGVAGAPITFFTDTTANTRIDPPRIAANPAGGGSIAFDVQNYSTVFEFGGTSLKLINFDPDFNSPSSGGIDILTTPSDGMAIVMAVEYTIQTGKPYIAAATGTYDSSGTSAFTPTQTTFYTQDDKGKTVTSNINAPQGAGDPVVVANPQASLADRLHILYPVMESSSDTTTDIVDQDVKITTDDNGGGSEIDGTFEFSANDSFLAPGGEIVIPDITLDTDDANPSRIHGKGVIAFTLAPEDGAQSISLGKTNVSIKFDKGSGTSTGAKNIVLKIPADAPVGRYELNVFWADTQNLPDDVNIAEPYLSTTDQKLYVTLDLGTIADSKHPLITTDSSGVQFKVSISGRGTATVTDGLLGKDITITGSDEKTNVTITPQTRIPIEIEDIKSTGKIGALNASKTDLIGDISLEGASKINISRIRDNHIVSLGSSSKPIVINIGEIAATDMVADNIKSLTVNTWLGGSLTAGAIGKLTSKGDFDADITADSIGNLKITGALGAASASSMRQIRLANSVGSVSVGSIQNADFFVAVNPGANGLPVDQTAFTNATGLIKSFKTGGFANTNLAAPVFGKISIKGLITTNAAAFGIAGERISAYADSAVSMKSIFSPQIINAENQYLARTV